MVLVMCVFDACHLVVGSGRKVGMKKIKTELKEHGLEETYELPGLIVKHFKGLTRQTSENLFF